MKLHHRLLFTTARTQESWRLPQKPDLAQETRNVSFSRTGEDERPLVLLAAPYFLPRHYGGVVQVYSQLAARAEALRFVLVSDRRECDIETLNDYDRKCLALNGFEIRRIGQYELRVLKEESTVERALHCFHFFRDNRREWSRLLQELQPKLVICGGTYSGGWLTRSLPSEIPLVNYIHGEELTLAVGPPLLRTYFRKCQRAAIKKAIMNIAVSRYTADLTRRFAGISDDRLFLLPNFVDPDRFKPPLDRNRVRSGLGWNGATVILSIARLERRKGFDQALRALAALDREHKIPDNWLYVIGGQGVERSSLEALAADLGISPRVKFLGFVAPEELPDLYGAADVFLQPNRDIEGDTEGFGIVFLEANACGTPVIGGFSGGTADAIEDGISGFRVDGSNVGHIADKLEILLNNASLRFALGHKGLNRVLAGFTVQRAVARFEGLISGVIDGNLERKREFLSQFRLDEFI